MATLTPYQLCLTAVRINIPPLTQWTHNGYGEHCTVYHCESILYDAVIFALAYLSDVVIFIIILND